MDAGVANRSSEDIRALVILDMRAADEVLPSGGCTGSDSYKKKLCLTLCPTGCHGMVLSMWMFAQHFA